MATDPSSSGAAATAKLIKKLLREIPDERSDALRLDELRQVFAKLVLSGELSFVVDEKETNDEEAEDDKIALKWRKHLLAQHKKMVQQLCQRIHIGKRTAVRCLFGVIAASPTSNGTKQRVNKELLHKWIKAIVNIPQQSMDKSIQTMVQAEFFGPFRDVQYYALQSIAVIANANHQKQLDAEDQRKNHIESVAERLLDLLLMMPVPSPCDPSDKKSCLFPPTKFDDESDSDKGSDVESDGESEDEGDSDSESEDDSEDEKTRPSKRQKKSADDPTAPSFQRLRMMRRQYMRTWMAVLRLSLPPASLKRALVDLPDRVFPNVAHPLRFSDFFMQAFTTDGVVGVLALDGLFVLLTTYGLEYPNFYTQLYRLVTPRSLSVKYRQRFFDLLTKCLTRNEMLPAHIVAAFCKRLCRCALTAPVPAILFVLALVSNMLRKHPECACLIHRDGELVDAFLSEEEDPVKSHALQSSLWELAALERHYHPDVATLAKSVGTEAELQAPPHDMADFTLHTYQALFDRERKKKPNGKTPLTFREPTSLFPEGDVLGSVLALGK